MINQARLNIIYIKTCVLKVKKQLKMTNFWRNLKIHLTTSKLFQAGNREKPYLSYLPDPCM